MEISYSVKDVQGHISNMKRTRAAAVRLGYASAAIRAFCVECVGGVLVDVRECTAKDCPLYRFRMGRRQD